MTKKFHRIFILAAVFITFAGCPLITDDSSPPINRSPDSVDTDITDDTDTWNDSVDSEIDTDTGPLDLNEQLILDYKGPLRNLACWGDFVAWVLFSDADNSIEVWKADAGTTTIKTQIYGNNSLVMSSDAIAWNDNAFDVLPYTKMDVFYSPLAGTSSLPHMQTEYDETDPRIDADNVIWMQYSDVIPVLQAGTLGDNSPVTVSENVMGYTYDISGDNVVFIPDTSTIMVKKITDNSVVLETTVDSTPIRIRMSGDYITYYVLTDFGNSSVIILQSIKEPQDIQYVAGFSGEPVGLDIDENYIIYAGTDVINGEEVNAVFLYDIAKRKVRQVATGYERIWDVAIGGGRAAWLTGEEYLHTEQSEDTWQIYTALLP